MARLPGFPVLLLILYFGACLAASSLPPAAPQDVQPLKTEEQSAVAPSGVDTAAATRRCPECSKHWKKVCADDGKTYRNECYARYAIARPMHNGICHCRRRPAALCQAKGRDCMLGEQRSAGAVPTVPQTPCSCCEGLICWAGPVVRAGQVLGRCLNATGPLPIG